ncbi:MAG: DMT family transporter [Bacteroidales bacterium]
MRGEYWALIVTIFWASSTVCFEIANRRIKPQYVNIIRLLFAFVFMGIILMFLSGSPIPIQSNLKAWLWLGVSGLVGFSFGDYFMFKSYSLIPARVTQLVMTLNPTFAAIAGYFVLSETLSMKNALGMCVTIFGISLAILQKGSGENHRKLEMKLPLKGIFYGFLGAIGQGVGFVMSKEGMIYYKETMHLHISDIPLVQNLYIPLAGTQMRILAGIIAFLLIFIFTKDYGNLIRSFNDRKGIFYTMLGALVGPVIGVSLALLAIQTANTAVASTIMAIVPIILIIPDRFIFKRKVSTIEIVGAFISVGGIAILM